MRYIPIIALFITSLANAVDIDLGVHYVKTESPPNNMWYQEEFKHSIKSDDIGYQIGLRFKPYQNIHITTGYKYLGEFSVSSDFIGDDRAYYQWRDTKQWEPALSHLTGKGKAHGIYIKGEYHFKHVFLTLGRWFHKAEWDVSSPAEQRVHIDGPNIGQVHSVVNYQHHNEAQGAWGTIAGIGVKCGQFSVLAEIWDIDNKGTYPTTYLGESQVITLLYTF